MRLVDPRHEDWRPWPDGPDANDAAGAPVLVWPPSPSWPQSPPARWLLDLSQWQALRSRWPAVHPVGVRLPNDADPSDLEVDVSRLALVVLQFPKWTDGRAYSQAHLLRARWGYAGELRATGDVVADMLPLLHRTGFDAAVLRADQRTEVAQRALGFFRAHYQGDWRAPGRLQAAG